MDISFRGEMMEVYWCIDCGKSFSEVVAICDECGGWTDHDDLCDDIIDDIRGDICHHCYSGLRLKNGSWYTPSGYVWVTNIKVKSLEGLHGREDEHGFYLETLKKLREQYGDVQVVDICSDVYGKETRDVNRVALYVPEKR